MAFSFETKFAFALYAKYPVMLTVIAVNILNMSNGSGKVFATIPAIKNIPIGLKSQISTKNTLPLNSSFPTIKYVASSTPVNEFRSDGSLQIRAEIKNKRSICVFDDDSKLGFFVEYFLGRGIFILVAFYSNQDKVTKYIAMLFICKL